MSESEYAMQWGDGYIEPMPSQARALELHDRTAATVLVRSYKGAGEWSQWRELQIV